MQENDNKYINKQQSITIVIIRMKRNWLNNYYKCKESANERNEHKEVYY